MAKVRFAGAEIFAKPLRQLPNGDQIMEALQHSARTSPGTHIRVTKKEIVDQDAMPPSAEAPKETAKSFSQLIAALEDERKTIPSVQEVLAKFHADNKRREGKPGGHNGPQEVQAEP